MTKAMATPLGLIFGISIVARVMTLAASVSM